MVRREVAEGVDLLYHMRARSRRDSRDVPGRLRHPGQTTREHAVALRDLLRDHTCTPARIAALLRAWPQAA